ncbi:hypothetical protein E4U43_001755 [Claviceps pusilla]|uniref:Uncharacterized protein n=1 Tax=Claviceps pusilla TaxID=123648 RepID=A0A9P7SXZ7_9HYPO|nr:hypothetical protein E4U43_001755 [Claviceps pusilla]
MQLRSASRRDEDTLRLESTQRRKGPRFPFGAGFSLLPVDLSGRWSVGSTEQEGHERQGPTLHKLEPDICQ